MFPLDIVDTGSSIDMHRFSPLNVALQIILSQIHLRKFAATNALDKFSYASVSHFPISMRTSLMPFLVAAPLFKSLRTSVANFA